jgi:glutamyl-Q tRNA(Asp) synthetase
VPALACRRRRRHNRPVAYRGRFAPSPTGALHFGSLVAALASWLDARAAGGQWLLRIEDIDTPRNRPGAADAICRMLERLGLHWDGPVCVQRLQLDAYRAALDALIAAGHAYPCTCTRTEVAAAATRTGIEGPVYPGTCRSGLPPGRSARAWRLRVDDHAIAFDDRIRGRIVQHLESDIGDFVVHRADGIFAYQLAVVVDDAAQGVTDVVRGADLLDSTPRQLWLQHLLGLPVPRHAHLPLALNADGQKLSKQTFAPTVDLIDDDAAVSWLRRALAFLGQPLPPIDAGRDEVLAHARDHWSITRVPAHDSVVDG